MSARGQLDVLEIVARYAAGYFPLYDLDAQGKPEGRFYWERLAFRAVLPVNGEALRRARQVGRRGRRKFEIRRTTAVEEVIDLLSREHIKPRTWVKGEVVWIYRALHAAGLLRTIEAWERATIIEGASEGGRPDLEKSARAQSPGRLVGALLGVDLPGTFVAETMFGLVPEASKICLCQLVEDCFVAGVRWIDVQTPHDRDGLLADMDAAGPTPKARPEKPTAHPCVRLGEEVIPVGAFIRQLRIFWKAAFDGDVQDWLTVHQRHP